MRNSSPSNQKLPKKQGSSAPIKKQQNSQKNNSVRTRTIKKKDSSLTFSKRTIDLEINNSLNLNPQNTQTIFSPLLTSKNSYAPSPPCSFSNSTLPGTPNSLSCQNSNNSTCHSAFSPPLEKKLRTIEDYNKFLEVPVLTPTFEEFKDPYKFIQKLYSQKRKEGVFKIIPPKGWSPNYKSPSSTKGIPSRIQIINNLSKGVAFENNPTNLSYNAIKDFAESFSKNYNLKTADETKLLNNQQRKNEYEYWSLIENENLDEVKVQYAADLPCEKFGSAFPDKTDDTNISSNHPFNLNNINKVHNSLFQAISYKESISGISTPWVYFGMLFATFCFHVEDLYMYALNYLHYGSPKTWYTIPAEYKEKFDQIYEKIYPNVFKKQPGIMKFLNLQLNPLEAVLEGIPVYRVDQNPGEFIFTFPKVYHGGFSHGFNCGEAVNIVTPEWIPFYYEGISKKAGENPKIRNQVNLQWMLTQCLLQLEKISFDLDYLIQIQREWNLCVENEVRERKTFLNTISKVTLFEFFNKNERYDRHPCKLCPCYCYLSYIYCNKCLASGCTKHISICACLNSTHSLYERFSEQELLQFSEKLNKLIQEQQQKNQMKNDNILVIEIEDN